MCVTLVSRNCNGDMTSNLVTAGKLIRFPSCQAPSLWEAVAARGGYRMQLSQMVFQTANENDKNNPDRLQLMCLIINYVAC